MAVFDSSIDSILAKFGDVVKESSTNTFSDIGISAPLSISPEDMDIVRALSLIPDVALYIISSKKISIISDF